MTEFETRVRRDTDEVYTRLDDEQTGRQLLAGRLNKFSILWILLRIYLRRIRDIWRLDDAQTERQMVTSRVNMLVKDRRLHARIARLIEIKAMMSQEAWGWSMDAGDLACTEVMALRTQVVAQRSEIIELRAADRKRQT
ncbi:hypothetical protein Tco_1449426 [Tanacetum coccineum]